jgi:hypothetical protein
MKSDAEHMRDDSHRRIVRWARVAVCENSPQQHVLSPKDFRRIALGMEDAIEGAHMGHPDFRVNGRIFATLHHDRQWGMVKLTPDQQQKFVREHPTTFVPENGAWGRGGCTAVRLDAVGEDTLGEAMTLAWQNTARKDTAAKQTSRKPVARKAVVGRSKPRRTIGRSR